MPAVEEFDLEALQARHEEWAGRVLQLAVFLYTRAGIKAGLALKTACEQEGFDLGEAQELLFAMALRSLASEHFHPAKP